MRRIIGFVAFLIALCVLTSCSSAGTGDVGEGVSSPDAPGGSNAAEGKLPYVADYAGRDISYTVTVSDGVRTVCLEAVRTGNVTEAAVTSPEGLAGTEIIYDAAGLRLRVPYSDCRELTVSEEASAGLAAVLDVMKTPLGRDLFTGGREFVFEVRGIHVNLELGDDGMPKTLQLGEGSSARIVTYGNVKLSHSVKNR